MHRHQVMLHVIVLLPQVYRARLRSNGQEVAVKVQRPGALSTISKDLYVMRRGIGVYEQLVKRFTAQTTDYQQLLSTFAEGLYTEMDFRNEVCTLVCYLEGRGLESSFSCGHSHLRRAAAVRARVHAYGGSVKGFCGVAC